MNHPEGCTVFQELFFRGNKFCVVEKKVSRGSIKIHFTVELTSRETFYSSEDCRGTKIIIVILPRRRFSRNTKERMAPFFAWYTGVEIV
jgi:hypothetical protein